VLARGKRLRARAHRHERIARWVVDKRVDLVRARRLEHFQETLRTGGLLIQRVCESAERRFVSGFYAELA